MSIWRRLACSAITLALSACGASPPHVQLLQDGETYRLTFPNDAISGSFWKNPNEMLPEYMRQHNLVPQVCRGGVRILSADKVALSPDAYALFRCRANPSLHP